MNNNKAIIAFSLILSFIAINVNGKNKTDSLLNVISKTSDKEVLANSHNRLSESMMRTNLDSSLFHAKIALQLAEELNDSNQISTALNNIAIGYYFSSQFMLAEKYFTNSLAVRKKLNDSSAIANTYLNLGTLKSDMGNYDEALNYFLQSLELAKQTKSLGTEAKALNNIGLIYYQSGDYNESLECFINSRKIKEKLAKESKNSSNVDMSSSLNNIGEVYRALGDYDRALYNLTEAMRISQNVGDMRGLSKAIGNLGLTYEKKGDFNMAEEYYNQSLKIKAKINDKYGEAISFISLAQLYIKKAKYEKAIDFCEKGLALSTEINAKDLQKDAYKTLSEIYEQLKEYDKSLRYHKAYSELKDSLISYNAQERIARFQSQFETLETEKENEILKKDKLLREAKLKYQQDEIRKKNQISYIFFFIAFVFLVFLIIVIRQNISKKKINKTLEFKNFEISQQNEEISQQKEEIQAINEKLEDINSELEKQSIVAKQTDNAVLILSPEGNIEWVNSYLLEKYNLSFKQLVKETSGTIFNYSSHTDIKSIFLSCIKEKKTVLYETYTSIGDFWAQTTLTPILDENGNVSKLIAIDTDISKLKMAYSEIDKKNDLLNAKNIQITDSIAYAKKIQEAILPTVQIIQEQLPESFIFYKPKDIVSGDFYWFSEQKERIFLACVDCTGHGVPGAFMSIIGSNILDDLINDKKLSNPSEILQEMHKRVRRTLNISGSDISQDDGMDMMICCINKDERELSIAGANQYAYIIRNQEIQTISGGIYSIGEKTRDNIPPVYETNHFMIDQDTYVYMFSDGYQDQFGGDKNRKFMASNFKKLLYDNHSLGFDNQADVISQNFSNWKRDKKQIDDVLVVGFKLSPELL